MNRHRARPRARLPWGGWLAAALITLAISALPAPAAEGGWSYRATVVVVYDGDTMTVRIAGWPAPFDPAAVRLAGIDAPEIKGRARCLREARLAEAARAALARLAPPGSTVTLTFSRRDKYGRLLADVVNAAGIDVAGRLLARGLARPYDGGRRRGWCE